MIGRVFFCLTKSICFFQYFVRNVQSSQKIFLKKFIKSIDITIVSGYNKVNLKQMF